MLYCCSSIAQTNVSGGIFSNTHWTKSESPYIVTGDIVVFQGVTLTIDPGVVVKFNQDIGLELRGKLIAIGNIMDTIVFTSNVTTPVTGSWKGIKVIGNTGAVGQGNQVTMEFCTGEYANYFINLDVAYNGPYIFRHCHFANNNKVNYDGGMPSTIFEYCTFRNNDEALTKCQFESRVSNCVFINNRNGVSGIKVVESSYFTGNFGIALYPAGTTKDCVIENNNIGVTGYFNSSNYEFVNNTITGNRIGVELVTFFNSSVDFSGNTICNNSEYNIRLLTSNNSDLHRNCWCSTDSAYIRSTIYDAFIDLSKGIVNFIPISPDCPNEVILNTNSLQDSGFSSTFYPNPFSSSLTVEVDSDHETEISLYDLFGRQVLYQMFEKNTTLNTDKLTSGVYVYKLTSSKGMTKSGKVIRN